MNVYFSFTVITTSSAKSFRYLYLQRMLGARRYLAAQHNIRHLFEKIEGKNEN